MINKVLIPVCEIPVIRVFLTDFFLFLFLFFFFLIHAQRQVLEYFVFFLGQTACWCVRSQPQCSLYRSKCLQGGSGHHGQGCACQLGWLGLALCVQVGDLLMVEARAAEPSYLPIKK